jgi:hypothetical protein
MTTQPDVAKGREIVARWCNLAEQRLDYLSELFETGRWRRYHSEQSFLENIREAKAAVETWRDILTREATLDNRPIDLSWLGRPKTRMPLNDFQRELPLLPQIEDDIPIDVRSEDQILVEDDGVGSREIAPPQAVEDDALTAVFDLAAIAARYPILRNTL